MATDPGPVLVDDLVNSDLRPYRTPLLRLLSDSRQVSVTVWHGNAAPGIGAPVAASIPLPVEERSLRNVFWPGVNHRVIWQRGALMTLRSPSQVIVCAEVIHNLTVWLIALSHRFFGKRLVLRGFFYRSGRETALSRLMRRILHRQADAYIAYTDRGRTSLLADGIDPDRVFVSQNSLDTAAIAAMADAVGPDEVDKLRSELGISHSRVLLYLGRLLPVKGVDRIVAALSQVEDASLVIIGDGHMRRQLEDDSADLPVHFVGAIYDETELAPYLLLADLLVLPGRVGLTCVHGFASGVPCITVSDAVVEQSPEYDYIVDDFNGVILPDASSEALAKGIQELLDDPRRLERLAEGARGTAHRLGVEHMAREYERAVRAALQ